MCIDLKNGLIMEKHTVTCTEITKIWNHKYDTNSKAQPIEWRYVVDVPVVRLVGAFYRDSFFDGFFELAPVALPIDVMKDKLRVEVKVGWFGQRPKRDWVKVTLGKEWELIQNFSGLVVHNLGQKK
jgi:hypothetical protein